MAENDYQPTPVELLNRLDDLMRQVARQQETVDYIGTELAEIRQELGRLVIDNTFSTEFDP